MHVVYNITVVLFLYTAYVLINPAQFESGEVWLQYKDGSQLELQPSSDNTAFKYTDPRGKQLM